MNAKKFQSVGTEDLMLMLMKCSACDDDAAGLLEMFGALLTRMRVLLSGQPHGAGASQVVFLNIRSLALAAANVASLTSDRCTIRPLSATEYVLEVHGE